MSKAPTFRPRTAPRGAHPKEWVRPPDFAEFLRWQDAAQGHVRLVTLSPEWPGAASLHRTNHQSGCGRSHWPYPRTTRDQIRDAVWQPGATLSTHIGNGAGSATRTDDFIAYQLAEPRLAASFIVDSPPHLPDEFHCADALRMPKESNAAFWSPTPSLPALCPPGPFMLGEA